MEIQKDFKELLELLNAHSVDYVIVGGFALAFHGAPRYTGDLDIYIKADKDNATRIVAVLNEFGFRSPNLGERDFLTPGKVVQLGYPPVRIDIVTSLSGVSWEEVRGGRVSGMLGSVPVHYIGKTQFILNKRASGRYKDLADLEALGETGPSSPGK